ncbi:MAG TPA: hypothetical protein VGN86_02340 [Pyrinomonadaceae bacterium]|jgi:hypothetical protein|nr:hypothetical protein [Pyrinomonadaceae bacterium]
MKGLRHFSLSLVAITVLSSAALAGDIHIGKTDAPPDPLPAAALSNITKPDGNNLPLASYVADAALNLLQELLLVF